MILSGKDYCAQTEQQMKEIIKDKSLSPFLVILTCDPDDASRVYLRNKEKAAKRIGINCLVRYYEKETTTEQLVADIYNYNEKQNISGIIVQLPLPKHIDVAKVQQAISPKKDVDGFHPNSYFNPCTPAGCINLLAQNNLSVEGKHCVVIGRSDIVGKPLARMLLNRNATVSQCHSRTTKEQLATLCSSADFVFSAAGVPNLIKSEYLKPGCVLIDISINRDEEGNLCGDAAKGCEEICSYITPVPGGVGPITVNTLMYHTVLAALRQRDSE